MRLTVGSAEGLITNAALATPKEQRLNDGYYASLAVRLRV